MIVIIRIVRRDIGSLFEDLSAQTWLRLQAAEDLACSQGEETITDNHLLELKIANFPNIDLRKATKQEEKDEGIDWEWWIGLNGKWWRYAIQAKKLYKAGNYPYLSHKVKSNNQYQIDLLEKYAKAYDCIPLYCFYNFPGGVQKNLSKGQNVLKYWHCCKEDYDELQFGCTLAPLSVVRNLLNPPNTTPSKTKKRIKIDKTFDGVHKCEQVLPWRCVVACPGIKQSYNSTTAVAHPLAMEDFKNVKIHSALPPFLQADNLQTRLAKFPDDFYNSEVGIRPRRILVVNLGS